MTKGAVFSATYAESALISAYENGYLDVVSHLLNLETNPNITDENDESLLAKVVAKGDDELTLRIVEKGGDVNGRDISSMPLIAKLAKNGKINLVKIFIEAGADVNLASKAKGITSLYQAVKYNQVDTAELLLAHGANVNATKEGEWTPLMVAAFNGYLTLVKLLIKYNANIYIEKNDGQVASELTNRPDITLAINSSACD